MNAQQIARLERQTKLGIPDESARWDGDPAHWGQKRTFDSTATASAQEKIVWQQGIQAAQIVLEVPTPTVWRTPQVQTIVLGAQFIAPVNSRFLPRWKLELGVGGGYVVFILDAQRLQQVTVPAVFTRASLFLDPIGNTFRADNVIAKCVGYQGDGNSNTTPAQYTMRVDALDNQTTFLDIPAGANRFRMLTTSAATKPEFDAKVTYTFDQFNASLDQYTGPDMGAVHTAGEFLPIPAGATRVGIGLAALGVGLGSYALFELEL